MDDAPHFLPSSFLFVIEHMMPLCMVISWVYSVAMMIQHIVAEKEHHLKEARLPGALGKRHRRLPKTKEMFRGRKGKRSGIRSEEAGGVAGKPGVSSTLQLGPSRLMRGGGVQWLFRSRGQSRKRPAAG